MEIKISSPECVYIIIGDYTYYIDDSTGEQIMEKWQTPIYVIRERESGNILQKKLTLDEASEIVDEFEKIDIDNGCFIPNFYEIVKS